MNSPEQRLGLKTLLRWLGGASTLWYACSCFLPCVPPTRPNPLEDSWMQALHTAFAEHLQFGRDIVFTFGPWGFLYGGYLPATHRTAVMAWLGLTVVFWWAGWKLARQFSGNGFGAWLWLLGVTGLAGIKAFQNIDVCLSAFVVFWLALYFFVEDRPLTPAQTALVVCLGLLSLVKFSLFLEVTLIMFVVAADIVLRRRRFPWAALVFGASVLFFWIAAGQRLGSFVPFVKYSWQITSGFNEAMVITPESEAWHVAGFLACAVILGGLAAYAGWVQRRFWGIFPAAAWGLMLFLAFKYGYVRDDGHEVTAAMELLLLALATLACVWPMAQSKGQGMIAASLLPAILMLIFTSVIFSRHLETGLMARFAETFSGRSLLAPFQLAGGQLRADYDSYQADIRKKEPLPALQGGTDVYPWDQAALLANGLTYCPRPVIQSYSAYTPGLAELNAAFLRSDRAPTNILFQLLPMDYRFPALEDGLSWPELLTRYGVREVGTNFVILKKSATPREWRLTPLEDKSIQFGERVAISPDTNGPIWARIDIDDSLAGKLASPVFKLPILWFNVGTHDGSRERFRLIPGMAREGFLLSPLIEDIPGFGRLAMTGTGPEAEEVTEISVWANTDTGTSVCYRSPIRMRLYRVDFAGQDAGGARPGRY